MKSGIGTTAEAARVTLGELRELFAREFPHASLAIDDVGPGRARVRQPIGESELRPGGTVSGPVLMATADAASYAAVLSVVGIVPMAVTTDLSIHFLSRPSASAAILADATVLRAGRRLVVTEVRLASEGAPTLVAHATVTYAVPADSSATRSR